MSRWKLTGCEVLPRMQPKPSTNGRVHHALSGDGGKINKSGDKTARNQRRWQMLNAFVDCAMGELSGAEIAVWLILFRDTKPTGTARTSQTDLARRAGVSTRTVERTIARLSERGLLKIVRRGGLRAGASVYRVRALPDI
jgi:predicted transcriptional regulator